jgi:hypothetical protein
MTGDDGFEPADDATIDEMIDWPFARWPGPADELERARWRRVIRPGDLPAMDPELTAQAAWLVDQHPAFAGQRPPAEAFRLAYEVALRARTIPVPASPQDPAFEPAREALERLSADIAGAWWPPQVPPRPPQLTVVGDSARITELHPSEETPA